MDDVDGTLKERRSSLEEPSSPVETSRPKRKGDLETKFNTISFSGERGTRGEKALRRKKRLSIINNHIYDLDVSVFVLQYSFGFRLCSYFCYRCDNFSFTTITKN